jgi:hypothetical protein
MLTVQRVIAEDLWDTLGKRIKKALAARDQRVMAQVFDYSCGDRKYDQVIVNEILCRADRYVADRRR